MSFIQHVLRDRNVCLLYSKCRRETAIKHFLSLWVSIYDSLRAKIRQKLNVLAWKEHSLHLGNPVIILVVNVFYISFLTVFHSWQQSDCYSLKHPIPCSCTFSLPLSSAALLFGVQCWFGIQCCHNLEFEKNCPLRAVCLEFSKAMESPPERAIVSLITDLRVPHHVLQACWWGPTTSAKAISALPKSVTKFSESKWYGGLYSEFLHEKYCKGTLPLFFPLITFLMLHSSHIRLQ